jgi:hypothetical protein
VGVLLNASLGTTTTQLTSSVNPSTVGQSVTFTATVTSAAFKQTPTGTVNFLDGTSSLGSSGLGSNGTASFSTASLSVGTHSITAKYSGDGNFLGSTSAVLSQVVQQPVVSLSPTSVTFPVELINTTSKAATVTLTNTGLGILNITNIAVSGPFGQTNTCGTSLNSGSSCTFSVTFTPTTIGTSNGSISITDNAPGSPQKITLKGTGTYVQLVPTSVNFGNQTVGTKSQIKKITLTNKGSVAVSITSITITGTNAGDFAEITNCGASVAAGGTCLIGVTFTPSATGVRSASVSIADNGGGSPQHVQLKGTGI